MIAGEGWTPFIEHLDQPPARQMLLDTIFHDEGQTETGNGRANDHIHIVADDLAFDPDSYLASIPLQFPGVETTATQEAQIDALMIGQLMRRARKRPSFQIGW